jgi:hypothetical protein
MIWMSTMVFWIVRPCELIGGKQSFGGTYNLHLQGCFYFSHKCKLFKLLKNLISGYSILHLDSAKFQQSEASDIKNIKLSLHGQSAASGSRKKPTFQEP